MPSRHPYAAASFRRRFLIYFTLPFIVTGLTYSMLTTVFPGQFNVWIGLISSFIASVSISIWSELDNLTRLMKDVRKELIGTSVSLPGYEELMREAEKVVSTPHNNTSQIFVYKGYATPIDRESSYYKATIEAVESGRIIAYHRIMAVRQKPDIDKAILTMRRLCRSPQYLERFRFHVSFLQDGHYQSFLVSGSSDCILSFPDLIDPHEILGHKCGAYVNDFVLAQNFREVFKAISSQASTYRISMPKNCSDAEWDDFWQSLRNDLLVKLEKLQSLTTSIY